MKRTTIYLEPLLHQALRMKAAETRRSLTDLVNEAVRQLLAEDAEDLEAFRDRAAEPILGYEAVLKDLQRHGKI
jgi:hypothetical protein